MVKILLIFNLKSLSDEEVLTIGLKHNQVDTLLIKLKTIATAQGVSNNDIVDFEERINKLLNLQTADLMIDSEESVSSLIIQSGVSELSAETGLALFGKDFFQNHLLKQLLS